MTALEQGAFLADIPDQSRFVTSAKRNTNDVIHLVDVGAKPEVHTNFIPNPIGYAQRNDGDIPIQLDTHVTVATQITVEETEHIAYDKVKDVQDDHKVAIAERKQTKAAHVLTPASDSAQTRIITTSGDNDGTDRKRFTPKDLLDLKTIYDDKKVPLSNRTLVLSSQHYNDLLFWCVNKDKSTNHLAMDEAGMLKQRLESFKIFIFIDVPLINVSTLTRRSYGAQAQAGDLPASFAFNPKDAFKANGRTWNITDPIDTQTHSTKYNVRHNSIVSPKKLRGLAGVVSATI
ncbi:hypothetical protein [Kordia sp. SMS9]|uniref:hypothetical protein n=1 Tax=Kordia sp. SMS9 TaxID=2282170 RepID=UPI001965F6F7|nr:hypothetical protein [Kordia sp. SMS9]